MAGVVAALRALGGIGSVDEFRTRNLGRGAIRMAFANGDIVRVRRGWYALPPRHPDAPDPARVLAARVGGQLACISGAAIAGVWKPPDDRVHVSLFDHARHLKSPSSGVPIGGSTDGVVVHWDAAESLRYGEVDPIGRCLVQVLRCQPADMAFAVVESALRIGLIDAVGVAELQRSVPGRGSILRSAGDLADSGTESLFRYRMGLLGIKMKSQVAIDGVGIVDFVIGDRLVVEIDSHAHHGARDARIRDLTRDAILAGLGYLNLRFDYWMIMDDWELVASTVFAVIARGDHLRPQSR